MHNFGRPGASSSIPLTAGSSRGPNRRYASRSVPGVGSLLLGPQIDEAEAHAASLGAGSEITASMLAPGTELPCTVKLRIWRHDIKEPCVPLEPEACRLTISHAVLCRCFTVISFLLNSILVILKTVIYITNISLLFCKYCNVTNHNKHKLQACLHCKTIVYKLLCCVYVMSYVNCTCTFVAF